MSGNASEEMKNGAITPIWAWAPSIASLFFSAATTSLNSLYLNAHDLAYHQPSAGPEYQLNPELVNHEQLLSSARIVTAFIALILAAIAFRVGPRWMAWLSLIIGALGMLSIPYFTAA
jgi:1,4-dihydroxy-2-naphthoate octaprenyltransferase